MPFIPSIYVVYGPLDTAVYVEKPDGGFVAVYTGNEYTHGHAVNTNLPSGYERGQKVFG